MKMGTTQNFEAGKPGTSGLRAVTRWSMLAVAAVMLSGCALTATTGGVLGTALLGSQATLAFTKKLPTDHLGDSVTGLDCNYIRSVKDDGYFCRPPTEQIVERPQYCYTTLGNVECYAVPLEGEEERLVQ